MYCERSIFLSFSFLFFFFSYCIYLSIGGRYIVHEAPGYSIGIKPKVGEGGEIERGEKSIDITEMLPKSLEAYEYPEGKVWKELLAKEDKK